VEPPFPNRTGTRPGVSDIPYAIQRLPFPLKDSNFTLRNQNPALCQLSQGGALPGVFAPPGVTALFLPREGPDRDSQEGPVSLVGEVGLEPTRRETPAFGAGAAAITPLAREDPANQRQADSPGPSAP
jgi:hypothetical protein